MLKFVKKQNVEIFTQKKCSKINKVVKEIIESSWILYIFKLKISKINFYYL
jgi:hypothetical protein